MCAWRWKDLEGEVTSSESAHSRSRSFLVLCLLRQAVEHFYVYLLLSPCLPVLCWWWTANLQRKKTEISHDVGEKWHCCDSGGTWGVNFLSVKIVGGHLCKTETFILYTWYHAHGQGKVCLHSMGNWEGYSVPEFLLNGSISPLMRWCLSGPACLETTAECNVALTLQWIDFSECDVKQMRSLCQPVWIKSVIQSPIYSLWK